MFIILKIAVFILAAIVFSGLFFLAGSNFFTAGGSDAAEIVIRVNRAIRIAVLIILIVAIAAMAYRMSAVTMISAFIAFLLFIVSLNTVRVSGKDFQVVQTFILISVKRWTVDDNPAADDADVSLSFTWCCLVSNQASGTKTIVRGIWPLVLPEGELRPAFEGMVFR